MHMPYSDGDLEVGVLKAFEQYDTVPANEDLNASSLAAYFGKKSYSALEKDKRLISISWKADKGYSVMPTRKGKKARIKATMICRTWRSM